MRTMRERVLVVHTTVRTLRACPTKRDKWLDCWVISSCERVHNFFPPTPDENSVAIDNKTLASSLHSVSTRVSVLPTPSLYVSLWDLIAARRGRFLCKQRHAFVVMFLHAAKWELCTPAFANLTNILWWLNPQEARWVGCLKIFWVFSGSANQGNKPRFWLEMVQRTFLQGLISLHSSTLAWCVVMRANFVSKTVPANWYSKYVEIERSCFSLFQICVFLGGWMGSNFCFLTPVFESRKSTCRHHIPVSIAALVVRFLAQILGSQSICCVLGPK